MEFIKVHGTGNDFVLLPDLEGQVRLTPQLVRALCTPHLGLGADGVIRLGPPRQGIDADAFMDYRNADGGVVEMCGNGVRCVAKYLADRGFRGSEPPVPRHAAPTGPAGPGPAGSGTLRGDVIRIDTRAGVKLVEIVDLHADGKVATVRVDMGGPEVGKIGMTIHAGDQAVEVTTLSMGNPHAVLVVDDLPAVPVAALGSAIERHPMFPHGVNVEFITVPSPRLVAGRIWERGVGETLASGTGASAMAVAANVLGLAERHVTVSLPGGDLDVEWREDTLLVTGPAVEVASGELDEAWLNTVAP